MDKVIDVNRRRLAMGEFECLLTAIPFMHRTCDHVYYRISCCNEYYGADLKDGLQNIIISINKWLCCNSVMYDISIFNESKLI